jgi:WD40 repeat protein
MIVWDVGCGEAVNVIDCHPDVIYSMSFNRDGSLIATTCKDKKLRIIEPRRGIVLSVSFWLQITNVTELFLCKLRLNMVICIMYHML